ncbi:MAG: VacJ family lipoprotein [Desulforhopalus sp.]
MKTLRVCIVFLFLLSLCPFSVAGETAQDNNIFPDLLTDEFEDESFDDEPQLLIRDPLEPVNRFFFEFNDVVYDWVLKPVNYGYSWLLPVELRISFGNFFYNLASPVRLLNSFLQGDLKASGVVLERFLINSTIGVWGLVDIAAIEFDIQPQRADFGQTLGKWGVGEGIYFCWPLVGPSTARDTVGLVVDAYTHPIPYFHDNLTLDVAYYLSNRINTLSLNPTFYDDLRKYSLDPYIAFRQAYYEYRKAFVETP